MKGVSLGRKARALCDFKKAQAIANKGTYKFGNWLEELYNKFPYPDDFYADSNWSNGGQPWRILITDDNFKVLKQERLGKIVPTPKRFKARGFQRPSRLVPVVLDNMPMSQTRYNILFVNVGTSKKEGASQTAQQERGSAWILRRALKDDYKYPDWSDILNDPLYYQLLDVYPNVNNIWLESYWKQNNLMLEKFGDHEWTEFNRDGGFMNFVTKLVNEKFGITQKDQWNKADIWMIRGKSSKFEKIIKDELEGPEVTQTIHELNDLMRMFWKTNQIVGVSLKLISGDVAKWEEYNIDELTIASKKHYDMFIDKIWLDCSLQGNDGDTNREFGTQDLSIHLHNKNNTVKFKFQVKDNGGKAPGGNLKFEGTDKVNTKARAGKAVNSFIALTLIKFNDIEFENVAQKYPKDLSVWSTPAKQIQWRKAFRTVSTWRSGLIKFGNKGKELTEDEFMSNITYQYNLNNPNGRGGYGPWIARSKLMQLDFLYNMILAIGDKPKKMREFWTDMVFLSLGKGGSKGVFGPFGKIY
tara:strand:+ start:51 stop:1631 length:1581 start_codon:yes stop_codon:yes gene_type:complete